MIERYRDGIVPADPGTEAPSRRRSQRPSRPSALISGRSTCPRRRGRLAPGAAPQPAGRGARPWTLAKDPDRAGELDGTLSALAEGLRAVAIMLWPVIPGSAERILALGQDPADVALASRRGAPAARRPRSRPPARSSRASRRWRRSRHARPPRLLRGRAARHPGRGPGGGGGARGDDRRRPRVERAGGGPLGGARHGARGDRRPSIRRGRVRPRRRGLDPPPGRRPGRGRDRRVRPRSPPSERRAREPAARLHVADRHRPRRGQAGGGAHPRRRPRDARRPGRRGRRAR